MSRFATRGLFLGIALSPGLALAQDPSSQADALYRSAQALLQAGRLDEACRDFRASESLDSALGSVLSVAYCDEHEGKPATAWSRYVGVATRAHERGQTDREQFARAHAKGLESYVTHVRLSVAPPEAQITIDGAPAQLADDRTVLVPPGKHTLGVRVEGKVPWSHAVTYAEARERPDPLLLVELVPVPSETLGAAPSAPPAPSPTSGTTQRFVGVGVAGVGLIGVVVGTIFGVKTLGISSTCMDKSDCPQPVIDQASRNGIVSDVGFVVGVAGLGAGAALFFTAPRSATATTAWRLSPSVGSGVAGAVLGRAW